MWLSSLNIRISLFATALILLTGCIGPVMTGAQLYYERHELNQSMQNHHLSSNANLVLRQHKKALQGSRVVVIAFNHDLVVLGQARTRQLKAKISQWFKPLRGVRRLFNEMDIGRPISFGQRLQDGWITTKIRSQMLVIDDLNQKAFKIVTENGVVYILGDVKLAQAKLVVNIARHTMGVRKVIRILRYYRYVEDAE